MHIEIRHFSHFMSFGHLQTKQRDKNLCLWGKFGPCEGEYWCCGKMVFFV